jgi:hypothetical protein
MGARNVAFVIAMKQLLIYSLIVTMQKKCGELSILQQVHHRKGQFPTC